MDSTIIIIIHHKCINDYDLFQQQEVDGRSGIEDLRKMARMKRNKEGGETPLIKACKYYSKRTKWWQEVGPNAKIH